jgi:hypothetical protein
MDGNLLDEIFTSHAAWRAVELESIPDVAVEDTEDVFNDEEFKKLSKHLGNLGYL